MADTSYCSVLQFGVDLLSICLSRIRLFSSIHMRIHNIRMYPPFHFRICPCFVYLPPTSLRTKYYFVYSLLYPITLLVGILFFDFCCSHYTIRPLTETGNNIRWRIHPETSGRNSSTSGQTCRRFVHTT